VKGRPLVVCRNLVYPVEHRARGLGASERHAYTKEAVRPRDGEASTAQGRPHSIFKRAIQRRNVVAALAAARELPELSLDDALELTLLVARKDPRRHTRIAARWLARYLEEDPAATIEEAGLAASALLALPVPVTRRRCRHCGPWPKERLGGAASAA
jgi:hypothetical protein